MKKYFRFFVLVLILCLVPLFSAMAQTGTVTVDALNVRASASTDSNVVGVVHQGEKVTIKDSTGNWYKINCNGKSGYVWKKYINLSSSSSSGSSSKGSSSSSSKGTCQPGDTGDAVRKVQKRLIALGYLSGSADGKVNSSTLDALNSSSARKAGSSSSSSSSSKGTCQPGDTGDAVRKVQKRLIALGYLSGSADGDYGNMTKKAVTAFQQRNGLNVTGSVNSNTLAKLNSSSDCRTGKIFTCKRWSGYNHLDAEPNSYSDTQTMLSIVGHWTWRRRPILVKYNGHVYAASMNAMPHGTSTISNNGFDGHFCIHFYKSKTHESGQVDSAHQQCVAEAMGYSW